MDSHTALEMWGGIECTVNRVGNEYFDQLRWNGHAVRLDDLDRIAEIGIRTLRYPILWERHVSERGDYCWDWADERLGRLRELGINPIVGLVHHGSGPVNTSLIDPHFPQRLAEFAGQVARRYPWVRDYTPVNEPLTTARFSGLYGHWYPHHRTDQSFVTALLQQCHGVAEAMRAIWAVRPDARLIQTDDLGKVYAPPALQAQADFENERRWVTFDLLCGRVDRGHPMWGFLTWAGAAVSDLEEILSNPCPPDIFGFNYYLTSERYLDDQIDRYPPSRHGGNGRQTYVDVEAIRACPSSIKGVAGLIEEAWQRFHLPMAITEAHLGCTREEQLRWLAEVWQHAHSLRVRGIDLRAVTAWSLLGAYDWDRLVTAPRGHYEPGAFHVGGASVRRTALGNLIQQLATGGDPEHPVLAVPGWWRRTAEPGECNAPAGTEPSWNRLGRPILIAGGNGVLAQVFARACLQRGIAFRLLPRNELDIADKDSVVAALDQFHPWAIINAAGFVRVDQAELVPDVCFRENAIGPAVLASVCAPRGVRLVTFSSDFVFDGHRTKPYQEDDPTGPRNVYGRSKARAEQTVLQIDREALIIRSGALFGPWDRQNFLSTAMVAIAGGQPFHAASDLTVSPTYAPDMAHAALDLLIDEVAGVWHVANEGAMTWEEFAHEAVKQAGLDANAVVGRPAADFGWTAARPQYSVLATNRGSSLPCLEDAVSRFLRECPWQEAIAMRHAAPAEAAPTRLQRNQLANIGNAG